MPKKKPIKVATIYVEKCDECPHYNPDSWRCSENDKRIRCNAIPKWCPLPDAWQGVDP